MTRIISCNTVPHCSQPTWSLLLPMTLALSLAACGGGDSATTPVSTSQTTAVPVTVIDGVLTGAVVCLDKNRNGICDTGEPTATTGPTGFATLTVANADIGMFPIVVMVPTTAVDADTGPVAAAYVLQAPADQTAVVSPLTTLVQAQVALAGGTSAQAATLIQSQTGLSVSPFANYTTTRTTNVAAAAAANLARLIVLATQQQVASLASTVGQADISGALVTATDLQKAAITSLLASLPALGVASSGSSVTAALTPAAADAALAALAASLIANGQAGLSASTVLATIGSAKLPVDASTTTTTTTAVQPTAALSALTFTDANNWSFRAVEATAADNTVDASGKFRYYDNHTQDAAGTLTSWGFGNTAARQADQHWDGSAWASCPLGFRNSQTPRDANGIASYNYCDNREVGTSQRSTVDIGGKTLLSVIGTIRAFPGSSSSGVAYANFGPTDLNLLGTATFPTGSSLFYYRSQVSAAALSYDVQTSSIVSAYTVAVAAGGNASAAATTPAACSAVTATNYSIYYAPVGTLEQLIATNPGSPCVYGATTGTLNLPNAWWGNSTIGVGVIAGALSAPSSYFSTTENLRVAFVPTGTVAVYLSCLGRASDNSTRNCTELGRGTYAIQTLGDARVMTFSNQPAEFHRLSYSRVFVERAGNVHFGYQNSVGSVPPFVRVNLPAANAIFTQLGMPALTPQ